MRCHKKPLTLILIALFLSLSFNAYACLVPIYGSMEVSSGSDCTKPGEEPASQFCDGFKSLAVQSNVDKPSGGLSHSFLAGNAPYFHPIPMTHLQIFPRSETTYLPSQEDTLVLISVFRI